MCTDLHGRMEHPLQNYNNEASYNLSGSRWKVSVIFLEKSYPLCSHYWDEAQFQLPPQWYDPYIWVWWKECWCYGAEHSVWIWYVADLSRCSSGYADDAPLTCRQSNSLCVHCTPDHTHTGYCILQTTELFITTSVKVSNPTTTKLLFPLICKGVTHDPLL
jgi:hypothetical protein